MNPEEKAKEAAAAKLAVEAKEAADAKKLKSATKKVKVHILASNLAGKYLLPYNPGQEVKLDAKQAEELIAAGDAKEVK